MTALQMQMSALEAAVEERDHFAAQLQLLQGRSDDAAGERQRAAHYQGVRPSHSFAGCGPANSLRSPYSTSLAVDPLLEVSCCRSPAVDRLL